MTSLTIASSHVRAEVQLLGGMVAPAWFRLGRREVSPFAVAPWADDPRAGELPGILKRLRGEWPGVPFGIASSATLPPGWRPPTGEEPDDNPHGFGANNLWQVSERKTDSATLEIAYPETHPIRSLSRTITASQTGPRLELELRIEARRDCTLPIGIHPTFALPDVAGDNRIVLDPGARCWTPPTAVEPGISRFAVGAEDAPAQAIPLAGGGTIDATRVPLAFATEELMLATRANGRARLECPTHGYAVDLAWDPEVFASCLFWFSNRGRTAYPWNGRFLALGMEPVTSAFDLGSAISANPGNPLAAAGIATARRFFAGERLVTRYAISIATL